MLAFEKLLQGTEIVIAPARHLSLFLPTCLCPLPVRGELVHQVKSELPQQHLPSLSTELPAWTRAMLRKTSASAVLSCFQDKFEICQKKQSTANPPRAYQAAGALFSLFLLSSDLNHTFQTSAKSLSSRSPLSQFWPVSRVWKGNFTPSSSARLVIFLFLKLHPS